MNGFSIPTGLTREGRRVAQEIVRTLAAHDALGSRERVFYTPKEWAARGEDYGHGSLLIIVHEGGDHAPFFNLDACAYTCFDEMQRNVSALGVGYVEQCTGWYSAVYPSGDVK
jgi:hypothetical protein